jgi:hypothetical protein
MVKYLRALIVLLFLVGTFGWSQSVSDVPIEIDVPVHPMPIKANGKVHLLYELHLTNLRTLKYRGDSVGGFRRFCRQNRRVHGS